MLVRVIHPVHQRIVTHHRDLHSSPDCVVVQCIGPAQGIMPDRVTFSPGASRVFPGRHSMNSITSMETSNRYCMAQELSR